MMDPWSLLLFPMQATVIILHIYFLARCFVWKKRARWARVAVCLAYVLLRMADLYLLPDFPPRPLLSIGVTFLLAHALFHGSDFSHFVWSVIAVVLSGIADCFVASVLWLMGPSGSYVEALRDERVFLLGMGISMVITAIAYHCATIGARVREPVSVGNHLLLLATPLGCIGIVYILIGSTMQHETGLSGAWMSMAASVCLLIICTATVSLYNRQQHLAAENMDNQLMLRTAEHMQSQYQQMCTVQERMQKIEHDMKNHITIIQQLHNKGEKEQMREYIAEIEQQIGQTSYLLTGHPVLDTIIHGKCLQAWQEEITTDIHIDLPPAIPISDVDLCALFGNLLDNALEAVCALGGAPARFIKLSAKMSGARWSIICRNSAGEGCYRSFSFLPSTKNRPGIHGIGTKQIQRIVESVDGAVAFELEDGVFSALVMLPVRERAGSTDAKEVKHAATHTVLH